MYTKRTHTGLSERAYERFELFLLTHEPDLLTGGYCCLWEGCRMHDEPYRFPAVEPLDRPVHVNGDTSIPF